MKYPISLLCVLCAFVLTTNTKAQEATEPQPVSVSSTGEMGNRASGMPSISSDGRFVAFRSEAEHLVEGDTNGVADIFIHDRMSGITQRVSISSTGEQTDAPTEQPIISANGRVVVFQTSARTLVPGEGESGEFSQIYTHDRLTGITERISVNERGVSGMGDSDHPSISADGRYVAFRSQAENLVLEDTNNVADVFIHDRLTGHTLRASVGSRGQQANASSGEPLVISPDGRTVVFSSQATSLAASFGDEMRLYVYNRVLAQTSFLNFPADGRQRELLQLASSNSAGIIATLAQIDPDTLEILLFDQQSDTVKSIATLPAMEVKGAQIALSGDGLSLAALTLVEGRTEIHRFDLQTDTEITLAPAAVESVALSQDGTSIAFTQADTHKVAQIYTLTETQPGAIVSGRVTDSIGSPLGLVTIATSEGELTRSDRGGYFFFSGNPPRVTVLTPVKEGYTFEPPSQPIDIDSDLTDLHFTAFPEKVLEEAQKDIGMPYVAERGESGPYHGYAAGYCTDLVLDAYTWGSDYNIQFALEQDYRAHPEHIYRWRDARDAHDMWRYLSYSGQMLAHAAPYQPGDIVFFDWSKDGEIDHVSLVAEIDAQNRPRSLYDATGVIASNPDGSADELPWEDFHESTVRGHARWSGMFEPVIPALPGGDYFQAAAGSAMVEMRLIDPQGNVISQGERGIPGGVFFDLGWEQSVSIFSPLAFGENYIIEISNPNTEDAAFNFLAHTTQDGIITERVEHRAVLLPGETWTLLITVSLNEEGKLSLSAPMLEP